MSAVKNSTRFVVRHRGYIGRTALYVGVLVVLGELIESRFDSSN